MKKILPYLLAASLVVSSVSVVASTEVSAKTTYVVKKGKLVNSKTGKVTTGTIVYKNKLYKKGVLAKGTILYKKTLYVNGKISSSAVKYKNTFYKKGKKVSATTKFVYKNKLYIGQKLAAGYKTGYDTYGEPVLYKNGAKFTGIYKAVLYKWGYSLAYEGSSKYDYEGLIYKSNGKQIIYVYNFESVPKAVTINKAKASVTGGAKVSSIKLKGGRLFVTIDKTKRNGKYTLSLSNVKVKGYGVLSLKESFKGISSTTLTSKSKSERYVGYKEVNRVYWKYKNATKAELKKVKVKEIESALIAANEVGVNGFSPTKEKLDDASYHTLLREINILFEDQINSRLRY